MQVTSGQVIVEILKAEGVKFVFGMPGGHTIGIYDALYDTPEIKHVLVRHEHAAASMAAGYAQMTGEPGICCVTAGPGATNLITGVAEAFVGALPMVILAGRGSTRTTHKGASQEVDQVNMFRSITKWGARVDRADLFPEVLRQAFTVARSGKPGPVIIDIPQDILMENIEFSNYIPAGKPALVRGDLERINRAAAALAKAKNPLIVAGGGTIASGASTELQNLAERLSIPVMTSLSGRGSLPDDHPLAAGGLGHHRTVIGKKLLPSADVILSLGCRFEQQETNWKESYLPDPNATYIQIDIDPDELGKSVTPTIGIVGDARSVMQDILLELDKLGVPAVTGPAMDHPRIIELTSMVAELEAQANSWAASDQVPLHPLRVIHAARKAFPRDASTVFDVGVLAQGMAGAFPYYKIYEQRSAITPSSFYGMGYASCGAPAAHLARPDHPTVCFVGDGSFQMAMHILPVAAELKSAVTWCILNDQALGSIRDIQKGAFNARYLGTEFEIQPDFAKLAEACGCYGERIERPEDIDAALQRAFEQNQKGVPVVLDFIVKNERLVGSVEFFK